MLLNIQQNVLHKIVALKIPFSFSYLATLLDLVRLVVDAVLADDDLALAVTLLLLREPLPEVTDPASAFFFLPSFNTPLRI